MRKLGVVALALTLATAGAARAESAIRYGPKHDSEEAGLCRLVIVYPASGQWVFHLTLSEDRNGTFFGSLAVADPKLYRQAARLLLGEKEVFSVKVGGELKGQGYAAGITFTPGALGGREAVDAILAAADHATSVRIVAGSVTANVPTEGLPTALQAFRRCRTERGA